MEKKTGERSLVSKSFQTSIQLHACPRCKGALEVRPMPMENGTEVECLNCGYVDYQGKSYADKRLREGFRTKLG